MRAGRIDIADQISPVLAAETKKKQSGNTAGCTPSQYRRHYRPQER